MQRTRIHHTQQIKCRGRNPFGTPVFPKAFEVTIGGNVYPDATLCLITVTPQDCPHCGGGHSEYCLAAGAKVPGLYCPFSFDYPWVQEAKPDWTVPPEIKPLMDTCKAELKP